MFNSKIQIKSIVFGLISSIISTLIFLSGFAFASINLDLNETSLLTLSLIAINLGVFIGGFVCGKILKEKGFLSGAINGFIVFLLLTLLSIILNENSITYITLIKFITLVLSSTIGGVISVNTSLKRRF